MTSLRLRVLSLRYSSWSIRPWLALTHAGARFVTETVELAGLGRQATPDDARPETSEEGEDLTARRRKGSVTGLFPVLWVDGTPIHESLAICEWAAETWPDAGLWPREPLDRARARAACSEMWSGFHRIRGEMSCHVFARVPAFELHPATRAEVDRVFEIWRDFLERHGGPFLTGRFGIVDCMYFPVLTRFRTYGVSLPADLEPWARELEASPAVCAWRELAKGAPRVAAYDQHVIGLGGDPDAALPRG